MTPLSGSRGDPAGELAEFVADLEYADLPPEAVEIAERCFLDTAGVTLAGVTEGAGRTAAEVRAADGESGEARVLGRDDRLPVGEAAFVNATAGHVHDFDDYAQIIVAHPSVVLVPAILAVGEAAGASGEEAIAAFVAGFEVECHLGAAVIEPVYRAGWFSTTLFGAVGAATAAAWLYDLDADRTRAALNAAAGFASGFLIHNGTATKPLQVGQAARSGVTAGRHAAVGATAADALAGEGGFYDLHAGNPDPSLGPVAPPDEWALLEAGIHAKKYPCCSDTHTAIAATAALVDEHDLDPTAVESVTVRASDRALDVLRYDDPDTGLEAMFSMPYAVASMIARGRVGIPDFYDQNVDDPAVRAIRESVDFDADPDLSYADLAATVRIETDRGTFGRTVEKPPGHHENPLSEQELREKFTECAGYSLDSTRAAEAYDAVGSLRRRDVASVVSTLIAPT